jgi:hypothetical protein
MSDRNVIHTVVGKRHKYEVVKSSVGFRIYRDGEYYKGSYSDLRDAVAAAEREAR